MPGITVNAASVDVNLVALLYGDLGVTRDGVVLCAHPDQDGDWGEKTQGLVDDHVEVFHLLAEDIFS